MRLSILTLALATMVFMSCKKQTIAPEVSTNKSNNEVTHTSYEKMEKELMGTWKGKMNDEDVTIIFHQTYTLRSNTSFFNGMINDDEIQWFVDDANFIVVGGVKYYYSINETYEDLTLSAQSNPGIQMHLEKSSM